MHFEYDWFSHNIPTFAKHLAHLQNQPCKILEIGCHEGRATCWLLQNIATHNEAQIDCIDIEVQENFWTNVQSVGGLQKVRLLRGRSNEMLSLLPLFHYDVVYVDGSHWTQNVVEDGIYGFNLLKPEGILVFDDYEWNDARYNQYGVPKPAIDFFLSAYHHLVDVLEIGTQVWLRKRSVARPLVDQLQVQSG